MFDCYKHIPYIIKVLAYFEFIAASMSTSSITLYEVTILTLYRQIGNPNPDRFR